MEPTGCAARSVRLVAVGACIQWDFCRRFRRETKMPQPRMARMTCSECNAWYNSERELLDHKKIAHRQFSLEQSSFQPGGGADREFTVERRNWENSPVR